MLEYRDFAPIHLQAVSELAIGENWESFRDVEAVAGAFANQGCIVVVALDGEDFAGFIQVQCDGGLHAHISNVLVADSHRGKGIGRRLVDIAFEKSGAGYIDLVSTEGSDEFYRSFAHEEFPGFRLYPQFTKDELTAAKQAHAERSNPSGGDPAHED